MRRRRLVRVPASSANLGPGYDVLAAALSIHLELEVEETGEFAVVLDRDDGRVRESTRGCDGKTAGTGAWIHHPRELDSAAARKLDHAIDQHRRRKRDTPLSACGRGVSCRVSFPQAVNESVSARQVVRDVLL